MVRPLRYIPYDLASGVPLTMMARRIVANSGGHLEECVKDLCRVKGVPNRVYTKAPLGSLLNRGPVRSLLGPTLADANAQFCRSSWNQAKHQYSDGYPKSVISVEDAIGSYFVARALGARVLVIGDRMESLVKAIEDAIYSGRLYITGELPRVGEDDVPWSVSEINHEQEGDLQQW